MNGVELIDLRVLDRPEEVHPVLHDCAAQGTTELMTAIRGLLRLERLERVQRLIAEVLERITGVSVAARFRDYLDDTAGREAELGWRRAFGHLAPLPRARRRVGARLPVSVPFFDLSVDFVPGVFEGHPPATLTVAKNDRVASRLVPGISSASDRYWRELIGSV